MDLIPPGAQPSAVQDSRPAQTRLEARSSGGSWSPVAALPLWPVLLSALLTGGVAFWGITGPEMWYDEAASVSAADRPLGSLLRLLRDVDAVHALYYLVMQPWVSVFGISELSMRTPSSIAVIIAAAAATHLSMIYARRWMPDRIVAVGLSTSVVIAVLPGFTWTAQEARGYAMGAMAATAALWCFELWRETRSSRWLVAFALMQAAAIGFTLYAITVLLVYTLRCLPLRRSDLLKGLAAIAAVALAVVPLLLLGASQSAQVSWIQLDMSAVLPRMTRNVFFLSSVNRGGPWSEVSRTVAPWLGVLIVVLILIGMARGPGRKPMAWLAAYVLTPMVVVLGAQMLGGQYFQERYFAFTAPALMVLLGLALGAVRWRPVMAAAVTAIVVLAAPSLLAQNVHDAKQGDNYETAAQLIATTDTVIFMEDSTRGALISYPQDKEIADPMLAEHRVPAANLWGTNHPDHRAWTIDPTGSVSVVSYKRNENHEVVLRHLYEIGCTFRDQDRDTGLLISRVDCPAPAAG